MRMHRDDERAKVCFERALLIAERAQGSEGLLVGEALAQLARVWIVRGDAACALTCAERALAIARHGSGPDHTSVADRHLTLALVLAGRGDFAGQKAHAQSALAVDEKACGPEHLRVSWDLAHLGWAALSLGQTEEAKTCHARAVAICEKAWGPEHSHLTGRLDLSARVLQDTGELESARLLAERALKLVEGPGRPNSFVVLHPLASVLLDLGDIEGAGRHLEQALSTVHAEAGGLGAWAGPDWEGAVAMLPTLGRLRRLQGRLGEAKAALDESLATPEQLGPPHWGRTAATHLEYGLTLQAEGDLAGAREHLAQAVAMLERQIGPRHPRTDKARRALAAVEAAGVTPKRRRGSRPPRAR
jgi:tetratricopeptide (TPR) repeat protein